MPGAAAPGFTWTIIELTWTLVPEEGADVLPPKLPLHAQPQPTLAEISQVPANHTLSSLA